MLAFWQKMTLGARPQTPIPTRKGNEFMGKLSRPIQINFRVNHLEREKIRERMKECGITNMTRYLRTMAINGCIIKPDHTDIKQTNYELHKIGVNINQIAKKANETGSIYAEDVKMLQEMMDTIWQLQKYILSDEP